MPILSAFGAARTIPGSSGVGKYSYDFNGSSYFTYPSSSSFSIGTQQFSIECFVYLDSYPSVTAVILDFGYNVTSGDQRVQFLLTHQVSLLLLEIIVRYQLLQQRLLHLKHYRFLHGLILPYQEYQQAQFSFLSMLINVQQQLYLGRFQVAQV